MASKSLGALGLSADPGERGPHRRRLRAHCGPARPRLLRAAGPSSLPRAARTPEPRVLDPCCPTAARSTLPRAIAWLGPRLGDLDSAWRGRQQVSPERRADVTHLAAGRSETSDTRGRMPGLECPRGRPWPQGVVHGPVLTPTRATGGSGGGPAPRLLLAWPHLLWGSSVGAASALGPLGNLGSGGFFPPDSSGNKNLEGVDEVRKPGSGHGVGG